MSNPKKMSWDAPTQNTDGSVFDQSQFKGFTLYIDGKPGLSIPIGWDTDGHYDMDLAAIPDLITFGTHSIALTVTNKQNVESAKAGPVSYNYVDDRVPKSPFGLAVA